jgi:hypothetical protein
MTTYAPEPPEWKLLLTDPSSYWELTKRVAVLEAALRPFAVWDPDRELQEHWTFGADEIRAAHKAYYGKE